MKKNYIAPSIEECPVETPQLIANSYEDVKGGGTGIPSVKEAEDWDEDWDDDCE